MTAQRQQAYLTAFSAALREMIEQGYDVHTAELMAHQDAAHTVDRTDAKREAVEMVIVDAIQSGAAMQRERTQGAGGRAKGERSKPAKTWVRDEWTVAKNDALTKGKTITKEDFARRILRVGGRYETTFPGAKKVGHKHLTEVWLKGF